MGWIIREKGVYDLVDAIPAVIKAIPGTRFVFAGNKETERLATMLRERGLESVATVAGWVSGNEKLALLRDSHLLVLPSYSEGVPNVLLEAMASGLPVLTTPVGGIPSLVDNGKTGLFTAPGDVAALTSNTIKLLADPDLRQQLAVAARARIEASCSLERVGHLLSDTYARYIDSNAKHVVNESSPT
jgi:glycosyltransferase involved in cell wall biosynthesis